MKKKKKGMKVKERDKAKNKSRTITNETHIDKSLTGTQNEIVQLKFTTAHNKFSISSIRSKFTSKVPNWLQKLGTVAGICLGIIGTCQKIQTKPDFVAKSYSPYLSLSNNLILDLLSDSAIKLSYVIRNTGLRPAKLMRGDYCIYDGQLNFTSGRTLTNTLPQDDHREWISTVSRTVNNNNQKYYISDKSLAKVIIAYKIIYQDAVTNDVDSVCFVTKCNEVTNTKLYMSNVMDKEQDSLLRIINKPIIFWSNISSK